MPMATKRGSLKLGRPVGERLEDEWELFHPNGRSDVIA
jgi:hypothetical protein